jgi:prepilin-type N-terminal cleavage/methylation domain-containing protein
VKKGKSGFTLLELLVVVGILAALVALALPFYQDYVNQSKLTAAEADLQTFKKALAIFAGFPHFPWSDPTTGSMGK